MIYVIYGFAGLFLVICAAMAYVFCRERHIGIFLMAVTYGTSGLLAITLAHWWPLIVGFVLVWMLRMLGLEPRVEPQSEDESRKAEGSPEEGKS
jgi:hypothetical protein